MEPGTIELSKFSAEPMLFTLDENNQPILIANGETQRRSTRISLLSPTEIFAAGPAGWMSPVNIEPIGQSQTLALSPTQADLIIITHRDLKSALTPLVEKRESQGMSVHVATTDDIYNSHGYGQPSPEAIQAFLDRRGLKEEADVQQVIGDWEMLMGSAVAQNTKKIEIVSLRTTAQRTRTIPRDRLHSPSTCGIAHLSIHKVNGG